VAFLLINQVFSIIDFYHILLLLLLL